MAMKQHPMVLCQTGLMNSIVSVKVLQKQPENIDAVRELIMQDHHVTYREIQASLGIAFTSIHSILHEHLAVKMICSRWISESLKKSFVSIGKK